MGAKFLALLEGRADVLVGHLTSKMWDTCATEAIVRAAGHTVTDYFGAPLVTEAEGAGVRLFRTGCEVFQEGVLGHQECENP